jgi:equilibrative nucleoside transporter 1/2/3
LTARIVGSIVINFVVLVFTLVLVLVDSSKWPLQFFYVTIGSIVLLNMSNGFYQNSIYGVAAQLPMRFTNAVILGNNLCGTLVSIMAIVSIAVSPDPRLAAFYYFLNALVILALCLVSYFLLPLSRFYRHYLTPNRTDLRSAPAEQLQKLTDSIETNKVNDGNTTDRAEHEAVEPPSYVYVFRQCALQCSNVYVIFVVTLLLFPTVVSDIRPSTGGFSVPLPSHYFTPVICYLAFNLTAMIGNMLPSLFMWPRPNHLHFAALARLAFVPFFLLCNYKNHVYPTWFDSDLLYLIGVLALGLSHGHLSSLSMMYASKSVPEHASVAGMLAAFCLVCGIFSGISLSFVF